jgi:hypothetical protein
MDSLSSSSADQRNTTEASTMQSLGRRTLNPQSVQDLHAGDSASVNAQFWLDRLPLRITAGWSMTAALLAAGLLWRPLDLAWRDLVLLWLLVDPLWGAIWRLAAGRTELLMLRQRTQKGRFWLPYLEAGSPAAQLFGGEGPTSLPLLYRIALPSVMLGLLVASALGVTALITTALVIGLGIVGWISGRVLHRPPVLFHALVMVGLPWWLTLNFLGVRTVTAQWSLHLALIVLWVIHTWGAERALLHVQDWLALSLMAGAAISIGVLLIIAQAPLWLALLAVLWLPTWLAVYQGRSLEGQQFWWLLAMLASANALGQVG